MLGTFPKAFSQVATSQGYFPKWQLPKCKISQATTSLAFYSRSIQPEPTNRQFIPKLDISIFSFSSTEIISVYEKSYALLVFLLGYLNQIFYIER